MERITVINPFEVITTYGYSWVASFKEAINDEIKYLENRLKEEAQYDGQPELAEKGFLYERFKENVEYEQFYGNWQVFKYFKRFFQINIFHDMIGEYTFDEKDKEMYNYFSYVKVNAKNVCKPKNIKLLSGAEAKLPASLWSYQFYYKVTNPQGVHDYLCLSYLQLFDFERKLLKDMENNILMKPKLFRKMDFFRILRYILFNIQYTTKITNKIQECVIKIYLKSI